MFLEPLASTFTAIFTTAVSEMLENRLFLDVLLLAHANINLPISRLLRPEPTDTTKNQFFQITQGITSQNSPFLTIAGVSPVPCSGP